MLQTGFDLITCYNFSRLGFSWNYGSFEGLRPEYNPWKLGISRFKDCISYFRIPLFLCLFWLYGRVKGRKRIRIAIFAHPGTIGQLGVCKMTDGPMGHRLQIQTLFCVTHTIVCAPGRFRVKSDSNPTYTLRMRRGSPPLKCRISA